MYRVYEAGSANCNICIQALVDKLAKRVQRAHQGRLDHPDQEDQQALQVQSEKVVSLVTQAQMDPQDHQAYPDHQVNNIVCVYHDHWSRELLYKAIFYLNLT